MTSIWYSKALAKSLESNIVYQRELGNKLKEIVTESAKTRNKKNLAKANEMEQLSNEDAREKA